MEPHQILQSLADKYAQCRSYSDCGVVDFDDVKGNKEQLEFRTHFSRPNYFCFEWQDFGPRRGKSSDFSTLWSMNNQTRTKYRWGIAEKESLGLAIAGATGCSAGAAHVVPSLLLETVRDHSKHLLLVTDLTLLPNEELDGTVCYVLRASLFKYHDHTLWIASNDFALRKLLSDRSTTAEQSEREHNQLLANTELMAKLAERGIKPPTTVHHKDRRFVTTYTYTKVSFDEPIKPLADPIGS